ncbi:uncharacterized protein LOC114642738 isoform X2 [Erpetoichthys calabaricus]|uniref:uncharacterized protein LOC114642738 isoform X2 n=1 Tax=Erpetoichthys calabaricus TaxID=27687 RepID=UPI0022349400|nr:uncharacterized protein LOC114642738 isoform X2 [Erpetoichthys calabaricus]
MLLHQITFFLAFSAGGGSVYQFPGSVIEKSRSSVTLHCNIEDTILYCYTVVWFKVPRSFPTLSLLGDGKKYNTTKGMQKICSLTISDLQTNDSATYYCAIANDSKVYFGNGTVVLVAEQPAKPTSMDILESHDESLSQVLLLCLVSEGIFDDPHLYWIIGGNIIKGNTDVSTQFVQNVVVIPADIWQSGTPCTCVLETTNGMTLNKTVTHNAGFMNGCSAWFSALAGVSLLLLILLITVVTQCCLLHRKSGTGTQNTGEMEVKSRNVKKKSTVLTEVQYASLEFKSREHRK